MSCKVTLKLFLMNKLTTLLLMLLLMATHGVWAQRYTISGYIADKASSETLISATVFDTHSGKGVATNNYGYYSLTLPEGEVSLEFSYIGYRLQREEFYLQGDTVLNISLDLDNLLDEVTVVGNRSETGVRGT